MRVKEKFLTNAAYRLPNTLNRFSEIVQFHDSNARVMILSFGRAVVRSSSRLEYSVQLLKQYAGPSRVSDCKKVNIAANYPPKLKVDVCIVQ